MSEHMATQKTLMGIKTEGKTPVKDKDVEEIAAMVQHNYHHEAYVYVAKKILRNKKFADAFEGVQKVANYYGHTTQDLKKIRDDLYERMKMVLKTKLSPEDYKRVHGAL